MTIESLLPVSRNQLYLYQIGCMAIFAFIAWMLALYRAEANRGFDIYPVLRSIGSGAAFYPSVLLIFYPVSGHVRQLFAVEYLSFQLSIGGAMATVLTLYGLFKR